MYSPYNRYTSMVQAMQQNNQQQQSPFGGGMPPVGMISNFTGGGGGGGGLSSMFGGGGGSGGGSALSTVASSPWAWMAAAVLGAANYNVNKGNHSWGDFAKNKGPSKLFDKYGDTIEKYAPGQGDMNKGISDIASLDFSNGFDNLGSGLKTQLKEPLTLFGLFD